MNVQDVVRLARGGRVHLGELSAVLSRRYGTRLALRDASPSPGIHPGGDRSFDDIETAVARFAAALSDLGVTEGQHVLIAIGNRIDTTLLVLAISRLRAVPAPVNPRLAAREFKAVVKATGASLIVADAAVAKARKSAAKDLVWIVADDPKRDLARWLSSNTTGIPAPGDLNHEAVALLLCTSGTTGVPKAAALTSRGLIGASGLLAAAPVGNVAGLRAGRDRVLAALPQAHVMGLSATVAAMLAGVPMTHLAKFSPAAILSAIEADRPNLFIGVPTMYADLEAAGAAQRDLSSIQVFVSAADAMPVSRIRRFQAMGAVSTVKGRSVGGAMFLDVYGMVELSGAAAFRVFAPPLVGSLTPPGLAVVLPGMDVKVVSETGKRRGWGRVGELCFRGGGVLNAYEGRSDTVDEEGWFATGDYARLWPGRLMTLSGRKKDRLKVGGFSVFPAEVEETLRAHPCVTEVAVVGAADERLGQRPIALVVPTSDFDREEFLGWAKREVAGYRRPKAVYVVDELPRGGNGKLDRNTATATAEALLANETTS